MEVKGGNSETSSFGKELVTLIRYNANQIKQGGWPVLLRKVKAFLLLLPFIPVVLIVRALRPLVLIRFKPFNNWTIGNHATTTNSYLCWRSAGLDNQRTFDIFYYNRRSPNQQLRKMVDRRLHVSRFAGPVDTLNRLIPGGKSHMLEWPKYRDIDIQRLLPPTPVHLSFTPEEERLGRAGLQAMGIPEGTLFVCFHSRDSKWKELTHPEYDFHIISYRDTDIHNHVPAAEEMTRRGYYAIRMGAIATEPLQTTNPMIIDYATNYRSDFMDIYLCAKCYFYIGDEDGFKWVPTIFRRPLAISNVVPIRDIIDNDGRSDLSILGKLRAGRELRFLTFRNIFDGGFDDFHETEQYEQAGVEPVENTAEEITALAVEMDERLKGTWQTHEEDEELQKRFWSIFRPRAKLYRGVIQRRIGADFLRKNRELLD